MYVSCTIYLYGNELYEYKRKYSTEGFLGFMEIVFIWDLRLFGFNYVWLSRLVVVFIRESSCCMLSKKRSKKKKNCAIKIC